MTTAEINHAEIGLLRFATAGSVDDGKSTLIGRLLFDTKALFDDQLEALERDFDLAKLTDGLRAEREQGITIDVAYRFFSTPKRRFIIADCPGHLQYTRNAITGLSTSDLVVLLVDVRHGVIEQTRRHAFVASLLRIPRVVFLVNKMDLVGFDAQAFGAVEAEVRDLAARLGIREVDVLPVSALGGDNITDRSRHMPWHGGATVLELLERAPLGLDATSRPARFPVQIVLRPERSSGFEGRVYAGQVASGRFHRGQEVIVLPSRKTTRVRRIGTHDGEQSSAVAGESVFLDLEDALDVARGDLIAPLDTPASLGRELEVTAAWMSERPIRAGERYDLKIGTRLVRVIVDRVDTRLDLERLEEVPAGELGLNDIGRVRLVAAEPIAADRHTDNPALGRGIVIDPHTKDTLGAILIERLSRGGE